MTSGIGGQPGTLMTGLSRITWRTGVARVGLGGGLHAAPGGARTPGDQRLGVFGNPLEFFYKRLAARKANMPSSFSGGLPSTATI